MIETTKAKEAPILVVGATGRHGATGGHIVRRLLAEGSSVRALVRRRDARSERLEQLGAELSVGDLHDQASLLPALAGVKTAYFTYPISDGIVHAAATFAAAARLRQSLDRLVVMSMAAASAESPSPLGRAQWLAEEVLAWAGLRCVVLRVAAFFYENIALLHAEQIRSEGKIRNCFANVPVPWIAGVDAAELAVTALLHPDRFGNGSVQYPPGTAAYSHGEIVDILSSRLGRRITFETVSPSAWADELRALGRRGGSGVNEHMAVHISNLGEALSAPERRFPPPDRSVLAGLIGREPVSLEHFLATVRGDLASDERARP
ncbi:MAG TPA: NmrA family NAD(P)-binding protein [Polyangiaceae bacterium]|nr:NmrA family NAD(P)-binding protein [Polyangiaceae bacterium]